VPTVDPDDQQIPVKASIPPNDGESLAAGASAPNIADLTAEETAPFPDDGDNLAATESAANEGDSVAAMAPDDSLAPTSSEQPATHSQEPERAVPKAPGTRVKRAPKRRRIVVSSTSGSEEVAAPLRQLMTRGMSSQWALAEAAYAARLDPVIQPAAPVIQLEAPVIQPAVPVIQVWADDLNHG